MSLFAKSNARSATVTCATSSSLRPPQSGDWANQMSSGDLTVMFNRNEAGAGRVRFVSLDHLE